MPGGGTVLKFKIWAENLVARGARAAARELEGLRRVGGALRTMGRGLGRMFGFLRASLIKLAGGAALAAAGLALTLKKAFTFETYTTQFRILFRDLGQARTHMEKLKTFAAQTPFQIGDIAGASRQLHVFTEGLMGTEASLALVGDAAAATGNGLSEVAMWVGRAYSMIKAGRPFGEAAMRLQEMGILTAKSRNKMEDLQKTGAKASDVFRLLMTDLQAYSGGMRLASQTGDGLVSTLKDNLNLALADFGDVLKEDAKEGIINLIDWLKRLRQDGTIAEWAKRAKDALNVAARVAKALAGGGQKQRAEALRALGDLLIGALQVGAGLAAKILVRAAPIIGDLIGRAASHAMKSFVTEANMRADVELEMLAEGKTRHSMGLGSFTIQKDRRVAEKRAEKLRQQGIEAAEGVSFGEAGGLLIEDAIKRLTKIAEREGAKETQLAPGDMFARILEAEEKAAASAAKINREATAALDKMEAERIRKVQAGITALIRADQFAGQAAIKAREDVRKAWEQERQAELADVQAQAQAIGARKAETKKEAEAKKKALDDVMERIKTLGEAKFDPDTGAILEKILKSMKADAPKLRKAAEKEAEKLAKRQERLAERRKQFEQGLMAPEERVAAIEKDVADKRKALVGEKDPGKRLGLAEELQALIERLHGAQQQGVAGQERRGIGLGEVFERIYGQRVSKADPQKAIADNTRRMLEELKQIKDKVGMAP